MIYIDSTKITVEQGESHLYLDVKNSKRMENDFYYTVLNYNDEECSALFSPEQMTFDYQSGDFHLKYFIDSVQRAHEDEIATEETDEASDSTADEDSVVVKEDTKIYLSAEVAPEFPGGSDAMKTWLTENAKYPVAAKRDKIMGQVEVTAVIEKNGSLSNIQVKHDIGGGCGAEAIRIIKQMPTWIPGQIKGEDKRVKVMIKVFFPPK